MKPPIGLPAIRFQDDEEASRYYRQLLETGTDAQKIAARDGLGRILENDGFLEQAAALYETNIRAGVRDRALYTRLALVYRRLGQLDRADEVLEQARGLAAALAGPPLTSPWVVGGAGASDPLAADPASGRRTGRRRGRRSSPLLVSAIAVLGLAAVTTVAVTRFGALSWFGWADSDDNPISSLVRPGQGTATRLAADTPTPVGTPEPDELAAVPHAAIETEAGACTFVLGFATLRDLIGPDVVGECLENQRFTPTGDARQKTTNGEMVWRKADNSTAFTDGHQTWLLGPYGLQHRLNSARFPWESDPIVAATPTPFPLPPALAGSVLPAKRVVSYYGNPLAAVMGVLGEGSPAQMLARLRRQAEEYAAVSSGRPIQPALELVAVVAQASPGADGLYRLRMDPDLIEEVARWADSNDFLLILDVQPGRGNVADEIQWLLPFLKRPNVHLALDPEFAMASNERPGAVIGSMDAETINGAIRTLADLVSAERLPPKLLIVHRFTERMITNYRRIQADPRVQVVIVMDGFGGPELKTRQYNELIRDQRVQYTGFKLFYQQDKPLMTPAQVLELEPSPDLIIYQ